jgi:hypothetical protein
LVIGLHGRKDETHLKVVPTKRQVIPSLWSHHIFLVRGYRKRSDGQEQMKEDLCKLLALAVYINKEAGERNVSHHTEEVRQIF